MTVCIASFEAIGELQRKRLRQSRAAVFCWNPQTGGHFLQAKSGVPSSLLRHRPHRAWSGTGTFYMGEVGIPCGGWCNGADFTEISKFPEILGELSMRKQCVPGSFFSVHATRTWERGTSTHADCLLYSAITAAASATQPSRLWYQDPVLH